MLYVLPVNPICQWRMHNQICLVRVVPASLMFGWTIYQIYQIKVTIIILGSPPLAGWRLQNIPIVFWGTMILVILFSSRWNTICMHIGSRIKVLPIRAHYFEGIGGFTQHVAWPSHCSSTSFLCVCTECGNQLFILSTSYFIIIIMFFLAQGGALLCIFR